MRLSSALRPPPRAARDRVGPRARGPRADAIMRSLCLQPSVPVAIAASSALCTIFVACLYLCTGKVLPNRNDPAVVKERFVRVGIASALAPFVTLASGTLLSARDEACAPQAPLLRWIGLWSPALPLAFASGLGLTMLLFLGPLVMGWLDHGQRLSLRGLVMGSQLAAERLLGCFQTFFDVLGLRSGPIGRGLVCAHVPLPAWIDLRPAGWLANFCLPIC